MFEGNGSLNLTALPEARNNRGDQQALGVGVDMRIQRHPARVDPGVDVGATVHVHGSVDTELAFSAFGDQVDVRDSFRAVRVAGDGL